MKETGNGMIRTKELMEETMKELGRNYKVNGDEFIEETGNGIEIEWAIFPVSSIDSFSVSSIIFFIVFFIFHSYSSYKFPSVILSTLLLIVLFFIFVKPQKFHSRSHNTINGSESKLYEVEFGLEL